MKRLGGLLPMTLFECASHVPRASSGLMNQFAFRQSARKPVAFEGFKAQLRQFVSN
jgi:hypothetical protein